MASYEKYKLRSGKTKWRVYWQQPDHTQRNKSGFDRKIDAENWVAENVTTAINKNSYVDPQGGKALIGELGTQWLEARRSIWKPSNFHSNETSWRVHVLPRWGQRRLSQVQHSEVQAWVNEMSMNRSATVVLRAFGILKGVYETAIRDGRLHKSPTDDIQLPRKTRRKHIYLTPEQLSVLAQNSGIYSPLILVLGLCGLRWGEATALTVADVDFENSRLHVTKSVTKVGSHYALGTPKNWKSRDVPLFAPVSEALRETVRNKEPNDLLFLGERGGYVSPVSIGRNHNCWYKKALESAGLPLLPAHDLRHTAASIAVHSGANVKAVQRMLGHSWLFALWRGLGVDVVE